MQAKIAVAGAAPCLVPQQTDRLTAAPKRGFQSLAFHCAQKPLLQLASTWHCKPLAGCPSHSALYSLHTWLQPQTCSSRLSCKAFSKAA